MSHSFGMFIILIIILIQLGLLGFNYFTYYFRSPGSFFASPPNGQVFTLHPIITPNVSTAALLQWANIAVTSTFSIDFLNYQKNLDDMKQYFTQAGFDDFSTALVSQGILDTIIGKKLVLTAVPIGPAVIVGEDEQRGIHSWTIQIPVTVSYLSASAEEKRNKLVTILVNQVPTRLAPRGIGIVQYKAVDLSPEATRDLL